jgi:putative ABC transport system permease protein
MKYLTLVWAGLWRRPPRATFTFLATVTAFLLFGLVQGVDTLFSGAVRSSQVARLIVTSRVSETDVLPVSHLERIRTVPGVLAATGSTYFGGYYRDPRNAVFAFAVDPVGYFGLYPEYRLPPQQLRDFAEHRGGAVIGIGLAQKFAWKIGDHVTLGSTIWTHKVSGSSYWDFDIVGIYDNPVTHTRDNIFFLNDRYFDESRAIGNGTASMFVVGVTDPQLLAKVGAAIDAMFLNSSNETKSQSEKEYAQAFLDQIGDVRLIARSVMSAVFFALILVVGNAMMQSVMERGAEFAVLKAFGFSEGAVARLVFSEAASLCVAAALLGLFVAAVVYPSAIRYLSRVLVVTSGVIGGRTVALGVATSVLLAAAAALMPIIHARRVSIARALFVQ